MLKGDSPAYTEDFLLADVRPDPVRRFTEYSGDLSGRYLGALATAAHVYGSDFQGLDALVEKVIALQKPDGYFGAPFHAGNLGDTDLALLWGTAGCWSGAGVLQAQADAGGPRIVPPAGDWLIAIGPLMLSKETRQAFGAQHFASSYICWMQQTEGLALLFAATGDERYKDLAAKIAAVIERRPGDHVHGYLTSLRGVMELHSATGDVRFLKQCETAWDDISASTDALITGGVPEGWSPNNHRTEGCAEADWVRLNLQLWKATENAKYLETAERAVFNEPVFNQFATGDFGHRVYTDTGFGSGAARAWWCCTLHGLRAFPDIETSAFRDADKALRYEMPVNGSIETADLSAVAKSSLGEDGTVRIRITAAKPTPVALRVRIPVWAEGVHVELNGAMSHAVATGGYATVERVWKAGDALTLRYAMKLRTKPEEGGRVSYWYGPWLLGASAADNPAYFNELTADNRLQAGKERGLAAEPKPSRSFRVPIAAITVPYAPAEYPHQPGSVTLRAIAEQSGQDTTAWEMRFLRA